ncbi:MAG: Na+/H+ antiporter subunit E [Pseudomonadota bacterium]
MLSIDTSVPIARAVNLFVALFALWLVMSGIYKPLIIGLGAVSCALTVALVARLKLMDQPIYRDMKGMALLNYLFWLTVEIGKADWAVTKVILGDPNNVQQRLIEVPANQATELGKMLYANSITITPGTVTVQTAGDRFFVHALTDEAADMKALEAMGQRVCQLERPERSAALDGELGKDAA